MSKPQLHWLVKWLLGALFAILMLIAPAFATFTYHAVAEDVKDNKKRIEKVEEAVQEIKTQGKVNEALQGEQLRVLQQIQQQLQKGTPPTG